MVLLFIAHIRNGMVSHHKLQDILYTGADLKTFECKIFREYNIKKT